MSKKTKSEDEQVTEEEFQQMLNQALESAGLPIDAVQVTKIGSGGLGAALGAALGESKAGMRDLIQKVAAIANMPDGGREAARMAFEEAIDGVSAQAKDGRERRAVGFDDVSGLGDTPVTSRDASQGESMAVRVMEALLPYLSVPEKLSVIIAMTQSTIGGMLGGRITRITQKQIKQMEERKGVLSAALAEMPLPMGLLLLNGGFIGALMVAQQLEAAGISLEEQGEEEEDDDQEADES